MRGNGIFGSSGSSGVLGDDAAAVDPSVSAPLVLNCPDGQIGAPAVGIPCMAIPGQPQATPAAATPCPTGQWGFPPTIPCMALPGLPQGQPTALPSPCPAGQFGYPPLVPCQALAAPSVPVQQTTPGPVTPGVVPVVPGPGTPVLASTATSKPLPSWVIPVGIGAAALAVVMMMSSPKKRYNSNAKPNRFIVRLKDPDSNFWYDSDKMNRKSATSRYSRAPRDADAQLVDTKTHKIVAKKKATQTKFGTPRKVRS